MVGFKQTLCALLLAVISGVAIAQNTTNSPYTRYGYGQLSEQNFGNSKAMGGIAYGLRDGSQINPLNPASYTAIDSLTFLFDGGFSLQNTNFSSQGVKINAKNSSFDYVAMQFRMRKWLAMSIGLLPYSSVGYNLSKVDTEGVSEDARNVVTYSGDGGLHQLYAGLGVKVLKNLSVGVNVSYFWGEITRTAYLQFPNYAESFDYEDLTHMSVRDYKLDFGAQYTQQFGKKHKLTVGAVFSPKHKLNNDAYVQKGMYANTSSGKTLISVNSQDTIATFGTPNTFGAGFTYVYDNRLTIGVDYSLQKWGSVTYMNQPDAFCDASRISLGAEYIPSLLSRSYFGHVKYRLGAYYSEPYYKINGIRACQEYGVTAGVGLPLPGSRSLINLSAQYIRVNGQKNYMVNENTLRLSIGITFNERWFFKRKVQ
ncbi:hypothetical protein [Bacteroides sp.]